MLIVEMAAPGMDKSDFKIELEDTMLRITSERGQQSESGAAEEFTRREFSYASFSRSFHLSKDVVETDKIDARYEQGILLLQLPKKEAANFIVM